MIRIVFFTSFSPLSPRLSLSTQRRSFERSIVTVSHRIASHRPAAAGNGRVAIFTTTSKHRQVCRRQRVSSRFPTMRISPRCMKAMRFLRRPPRCYRFRIVLDYFEFLAMNHVALQRVPRTRICASRRLTTNESSGTQCR